MATDQMVSVSLISKLEHVDRDQVDKLLLTTSLPLRKLFSWFEEGWTIWGAWNSDPNQSNLSQSTTARVNQKYVCSSFMVKIRINFGSIWVGDNLHRKILGSSNFWVL